MACAGEEDAVSATTDLKTFFFLLSQAGGFWGLYMIITG